MSWSRRFMELVWDKLEKAGNPYRDPSTGKYTSGGGGGGGSAPEDRGAVILGGAKLSGPGGSNPGGVYRGTDGTERYVKFYSDPAQAHGEHLANQLYTELGLGAPKSEVFTTPDGKTAYASELIPGVKTLNQVGLTPERANAVLDGFAADVVTANWDAVGLVHDNVVFAGGSKPIRVDNGGTFLMRAQAGRKPAAVLHGTSEFQGFNSSLNPAYRKVFQVAGTTPAGMGPRVRQQVEAIRAVRANAGGWDVWTAQRAPGMKASDRKAVSDMLEARTEGLSAMVGIVEKYNPLHHPGGTPIGGQFAPAGVSDVVPTPADWTGGKVPFSHGKSKTAQYMNAKLNSISSVVHAVQEGHIDPQDAKDILTDMLVSGQLPGPSNHPTNKKIQGYLKEANEYLDMKANAAKPLPAKPHQDGNHGLAKWNNSTAAQLEAAAKSGGLAAVAAVSVSTKNHASVIAYKSELMKALGGGALDPATLVPAKAPVKKVPKVAATIAANLPAKPHAPAPPKSDPSKYPPDQVALFDNKAFALLGAYNSADPLKALAAIPTGASALTSYKNQLVKLAEQHKAAVIAATPPAPIQPGQKVGGLFTILSNPADAKLEVATGVFKHRSTAADLESWQGKMPASARAAVKAYHNGSFGDYNRPLREGTPLSQHPSMARVQQMDAAFRMAPRTTQTTTVIRKVVGDFGSDEKHKPFKNLAGHTSEDRGFGSASSAGQVGGSSLWLRITIPKGTPVIATAADTKSTRPHKGEDEIILPRNTRFKIKSVQQGEAAKAAVGGTWNPPKTIIDITLYSPEDQPGWQEWGYKP